MDLNFVEFMPFAAILADEAMALKKEENVLIATDSRVGRYPGSEPILQAIAAAMAEREIDFNLVTITGRNVRGKGMPDATVEMILRSDACVALFSQSFLYTAAWRKVQLSDRKTRIITLPLGEDIAGTDDMYYNLPKTREEFNALADLGGRLKERSSGRPHRVHVSAANGTDVVLEIGSLRQEINTGKSLQPGDMSSIPAGNLAAGATYGSANGRIVFDERFNLFKDRFLRDPIQLTVENSCITKIEGGIEAEAFKNAVDSLPYPKEKILNLAEFGLGFNKGADFFGIDAGEWEKVYGAAHFGIGSNAPFGGSIDIPFHEDGMVAGACVEIDGETVTENGEFCI